MIETHYQPYDSAGNKYREEQPRNGAKHGRSMGKQKAPVQRTSALRGGTLRSHLPR